MEIGRAERLDMKTFVPKTIDSVSRLLYNGSGTRRRVLGTVRHTFRKGVRHLSVFEALSLMIAFAVLMLSLQNGKKK